MPHGSVPSMTFDPQLDPDLMDLMSPPQEMECPPQLWALCYAGTPNGWWPHLQNVGSMAEARDTGKKVDPGQ